MEIIKAVIDLYESRLTQTSRGNCLRSRTVWRVRLGYSSYPVVSHCHQLAHLIIIDRSHFKRCAQPQWRQHYDDNEPYNQITNGGNVSLMTLSRGLFSSLHIALNCNPFHAVVLDPWFSTSCHHFASPKFLSFHFRIVVKAFFAIVNSVTMHFLRFHREACPLTVTLTM